MDADAKTDDIKGRAKEAVGDLTNDKELQREGKADQLSADVKEKIDDAKEKAGDMIDKAKGLIPGNKDS